MRLFGFLNTYYFSPFFVVVFAEPRNRVVVDVQWMIWSHTKIMTILFARYMIRSIEALIET